MSALAPYVDSLVVYDTRPGHPGLHIGMPSTKATLVLAVDEPLDVSWTREPASRGRFWASVSGLHTGPAEIRHDGAMCGVQLGLTPLGVRALFGVPAAALAGELLELADVDPGLRELPTLLAETPHPARRRVVVRALTAALARHDAPEPRAELGRSLAELTRGRRVGDVADDVGYSRRHLGDLVRAEVGLAPKQFQRLARFERAHALVRAGVALGEVAARAGYADQSHLTREWSELAGCSPAEWRRRELPFVQDHEGGSWAG